MSDVIENASPTVTELALPEWYPSWAVRLSQAYFAGTSCFFVLHGNIHDLVPCERDGNTEFLSVSEFLGEFIFGRWDLVLKHNLSTGLQALSGSDNARHQEMMRELTALFGPYRNWSRDPDNILLTLDQMIERYLVESDPRKRKRMAVLFDFGQYLVPPGDPVQISGRIASRVVRFVDWARNPYIRRVNMAFCLIAESLSEVNERLTASPYVAAIEIPMPDRTARDRFVRHRLSNPSETKSDSPALLPSAPDPTRPQEEPLDATQLIAGSNGLSLLSLEHLLADSARAGGVSAKQFREMKKTAIERQCGGYLEFVEPRHTLDLVVGHEAACRRLREDAELISNGYAEASPMGYLFCGAVGTGKTFLAECYAGSIGIPCVKLKNFRSKYVGETEGNLQRVLTVLRSLGPVVVIIDEADASLGDRNQNGDSGTGSRVFSMIAQQMGDTRYRGRIIWMLLTCRPDLLPIDLKRQGRAEVHIPLFYPDNDEEIREMFRVMCRKNNISIDPSALTFPQKHGQLSGADIESIVLTAKRKALLARRDIVTAQDILDTVAEFIPSAQGMEKEMQELAAVLECTQLDFLNDSWRESIESQDGRSRMQQRMTHLRNLIESM
ncbi:MAG: ATP-binding protein [Planctomycetaceae bacterium]|nr:ATP-binding protein [Planctomycetaceae bacterium]